MLTVLFLCTNQLVTRQTEREAEELQGILEKTEETINNNIFSEVLRSAVINKISLLIFFYLL